MDTRSFAQLMRVLLRELAYGSPEPDARTYVLNRGDAGLFASLERLSVAEASAPHDGRSIAAHVDHLRYAFSLLNRWATGTPPPWNDVDWTQSWRRTVVADAEWRSLLDALRREVDAWMDALASDDRVEDIEAGWLAGSVAHMAYHLGAMRQIDSAVRGPTAEDEARAEGRAT